MRMAHDTYHTSVMSTEVLDNLQVTTNKQYIDATLGGGGHTLEIIKRGGRVLGLDVDTDALSFAEKNLKSQIPNLKVGEDVILVQCNFSHIDQAAKDHAFSEVDGILMDLGVSGYQLDTPQRGFSFQKEGPLDMRMDQRLSVRAMDLVNGLTREELADLFTRFGEEGFARQIANSISHQRSEKPIETTGELALLIERSIGRRTGDIHPATRVFQALRIVVNDELNALNEVLPKALELLKDHGRLVVITFHSLEDRIVKKAFEGFENEGKGEILTKRPVVPTDEELNRNKRSRSAKLRVFERHL